MSLVRWSPVRDLLSFPTDLFSMQKEIDRMFGNVLRSGLHEENAFALTAWSPAVDITEHQNEYLVKMELPGVSKDDVKISIQDNVLTVHGEKKQEKESKDAQYHRMERSWGSFDRSFTLPSSVKADGIDAVYKDGILSVTLPKAEDARRKQIEVKVK